MRVAIGLGMTGEGDWDVAATYVQEAEKLGADYVWSAEAWGTDAVTPLAFMAAKTSKIMLGAGIMQAVGRTPANTAMTAMTLQALSYGRFIMGLGASGPQVVEGWHGVPYRKPIQRIREVIEIVNLVSSGQKLQYDGEIFHLPLPGGEGKAIRSGAPPLEKPVPVYLATLSPVSLAMTGELADGWLGTSFIPEQAEEVFFQHIRKGAEKAGRSMDELDLQAGGVVSFTDDLEKALPRRKPGLAFTLGAMGSKEHNFYNAAFQRAGYEEEARAIQLKWIEGDRQGAAAMVPDEMVIKTNMLGTEAQVRERMLAYKACGVTTLRIDPDGRTLQERLDTLGRAINIAKDL